MKVDKGVCTTDTLEDLNKSLRYEAVFSTLVENKILAIKRDCEERQQKKCAGKRRFGGLLAGKRMLCGGGGGGARKSDDSSGGDGSSRESEALNREVLHRKGVGEGATYTHERHRHARRRCSPEPSKQKAKQSDETSAVADSVYSRNAKPMTKEKRIVKGKLNESTCGTQSLVNEEKTTYYGVERHETASIASDKSKKITFSTTVIDDANETDDSGKHVGRSKLTATMVAQRTRGHKFEDTELCMDSQRRGRRVSITDSLSLSGSAKQPLHDGTLMLELERRRLRILEAKSISAQCSPVFPRTLTTRNSIDNPQLHPPTSLKLLTRQATSEDSVNLTFSSVLLDDEPSSVATPKKATIKPLIGSSKLPSRDSDSHGFISSFNQLTSNNNLPVIMTSSLRSTNCDTIKLHRMMSTSATLSTETGTQRGRSKKTSEVTRPSSMFSGPAEHVVSEDTVKRTNRRNRKIYLIFLM